MEVILLEKLSKTGQLGDTVKVKPGYARNYLLPRGKAIRATLENKKYFEAKRHELEQAAEVGFTEAQKRAETFLNLTLVISANASDEGRLYGSVGPIDIAKASTDQGFSLVKKEVIMPDGLIHSIGTYAVKLRLHSDILVDLVVQVQPSSSR